MSNALPLAGLALLLLAAPAAAQEAGTSSGAGGEELKRFVSLTGESKYAGTDAKHYGYVNPDAPVGGTLNQTVPTRWDSFNPFVVRGTAAPYLTQTGGLLYDTLLEQSQEEASAQYPLIALGYTHPDDYSSATYVLNPNAKFHDGDPIDAEDVAWTLERLRENLPFWNKYLGDVESTEVLAPDRIRFKFKVKGNRELPFILGDMPVLPKHWWTANGPDGKPRDISKTTLEPPLGSGPYRIRDFSPGASIVWERVEDYWGWDTFTRVGRYNFGTLDVSYFANSDAEWQAFQKYGFEDYRFENRPEKWAEAYVFPAFKAGDVVKREFEDGAGIPMQGWVFNTRLPKFQDPRVREAIGLAFDFETMNRTQFFGLYERTKSYFGGSELEADGPPKGRELEILREVAAATPEGSVPAKALTDAFEPSSYADRSAVRANLRRALGLLTEAGYTSQGGRLIGPDGKQLSIEFLLPDPRFERRISQYAGNLRRLGIEVRARTVDAAQFQKRMIDYDFEVVTDVLAQSQSPGNEQREFWSSSAADQPGGRNKAGIKNPAVDALVDRIVFASDRSELVAATNALDRVLLHSHFIVPQFHNPKIWVAYWDKFGIPEEQPTYTGVDPFSWWIVPEKEAALAAKYGAR